MSSSEYSGIPFAVGTVTGGRSWSVDTMGRLVGSYGQVWRPGENVARCPKDCSGVEEKCSCGFYAYHAPESLYGNDGTYGVIEGYGVVVVGTAGFRCSKARVIGLYVPKHRRAIIERNYPSVPLVEKRKHLRGLLRGEGIPTPEALGDEFWTTGAQPLRSPDYGAVTFQWPSASGMQRGSSFSIPAMSLGDLTYYTDPPKKPEPAAAIEAAADEGGDV